MKGKLGDVAEFVTRVIVVALPPLCLLDCTFVLLSLFALLGDSLDGSDDSTCLTDDTLAPSFSRDDAAV